MEGTNNYCIKGMIAETCFDHDSWNAFMLTNHNVKLKPTIGFLSDLNPLTCFIFQNQSVWSFGEQVLFIRLKHYSYAYFLWRRKSMLTHNWSNSEIPECTCPISNNALYRTEMCKFSVGALLDMVQMHSEICENCIFKCWTNNSYLQRF